MGPGWRAVLQPHNVELGRRRVRGDERRGRGDQREEQQHPQPRGGGGLTEKAASGVGPPRPAPQPEHPRDRREDQGDQGRPDAWGRRHAEPFSPEPLPRRRMRGSTTAYSRSAKRLPSTTIAEARSAAATTTG